MNNRSPSCYRYFTWDANKFPSSKSMIDGVATRARKMVTIVDPHIKRDDNYHIHKQSRAGDHYVKNKDGGDYDGWCWPGMLRSLWWFCAVFFSVLTVTIICGVCCLLIDMQWKLLSGQFYLAAMK